jgi:hypothetical protein
MLAFQDVPGAGRRSLSGRGILSDAVGREGTGAAALMDTVAVASQHSLSAVSQAAQISIAALQRTPFWGVILLGMLVIAGTAFLVYQWAVDTLVDKSLCNLHQGEANGSIEVTKAELKSGVDSMRSSTAPAAAQSLSSQWQGERLVGSTPLAATSSVATTLGISPPRPPNVVIEASTESTQGWQWDRCVRVCWCECGWGLAAYMLRAAAAEGSLLGSDTVRSSRHLAPTPPPTFCSNTEVDVSVAGWDLQAVGWAAHSYRSPSSSTSERKCLSLCVFACVCGVGWGVISCRIQLPVIPATPNCIPVALSTAYPSFAVHAAPSPLAQREAAAPSKGSSNGSVTDTSGEASSPQQEVVGPSMPHQKGAKGAIGGWGVGDAEKQDFTLGTSVLARQRSMPSTASTTKLQLQPRALEGASSIGPNHPHMTRQLSSVSEETTSLPVAQNALPRATQGGQVRWLSAAEIEREVKIVRMLGSGGAGSVWLGEFEGEQVAVKVLHPGLQTRPSTVASLKK